MKRYMIRARVVPDGLPQTIIGRDADTLEKLIAAGPLGMTTIENPAPRVSHYVFKLRGMGFVIETVPEMHGGRFAGRHGRYVLRSRVEILPAASEQEAA